jgi:hypothetical protein
MTEAAEMGSEIPPDVLARGRLINEVYSKEIAVASYDLPDDLRELFLSLRDSMNAHPESLDRLRPTDDKPRNWYLAFVDMVLVDVQEGLAATMFHLQEIRVIESRLVAGFSRAAKGLTLQ